jgi:hypothetical protein
VQEKKPWKNLPDLSGVVERAFINPVFSGENIYPFRVGEPLLAVIPCDDGGLLDSERIELHSGLQQWWQSADELWSTHSAGGARTLMESLDFQSKLSKQLPGSLLRVVYNRSGMHICGAAVRNPRAKIGSGLYWASVGSEQEAAFICAILNAPITTELTRPFMSYGKDERDIAKHVWELPIPSFDLGNESHVRIAQLGAAAEGITAAYEIDTSLHFAATRRHIRDALFQTSDGNEINELVFELLS